MAAQSRVFDAYPDKDVFFTECSGGDWASGFKDSFVWTMKSLIIGSVENHARGVLMWNIALDENHGPHAGGCSDCRGVVTIDSRTGAVQRNQEYYAFGHASRFVRQGARRVAVSKPEGLEAVGFVNLTSRPGSKSAKTGCGLWSLSRQQALQPTCGADPAKARIAKDE